jgi:carboxymethylenebutenolidase
MCFGDDALPPHPPNRGEVAAAGGLVLRSADGTDFAAFSATPAAPSNRGIVLLPDVRGLHGFFKALSRHFAEAGLHTVAMDWFGRTAGVEERDDTFDWKAHTAQVVPGRVDEDVRACVEHLRGQGVTSVFTVGFCMGGAFSWRQSAGNPDLAGCIGFYGVPSRVDDVIDDLQVPLLVLAAGQDFTPVADVEAFVAKVPVEAELHVYPDAPHSFFDRGFAEHAEACEDAWRRMLAFVDRLS